MVNETRRAGVLGVQREVSSLAVRRVCQTTNAWDRIMWCFFYEPDM